MTPAPQQIDPTRRPVTAGYVSAVATAAVAGLFSLVVCALMAADFARREGADPLDVPAFKVLKQQLAQSPRDAALKEEVRQQDLDLREGYFRRLEFAHVGGHLLLLGVAVLVISAKTASALRPRLPMPGPAEPPRDRQTPLARKARWAVGGFMLLVAASAAGWIAGTPALLAEKTGNKRSPATAFAAPTAQPPADRTKQWPGFRGPDGSSRSAFDNAPTEWDATDGRGILWKTPVPLEGNGSPVVWANRVFLTGATAERREVYAFDAVSGKLLWTTPLRGTPASTAKPPEVMDDTGFAAPTPATDGQRMFVAFANGDVAAVDFDGKVLWERSLGIPENSYGHASSPAVDGERLIIQFDQAAASDAKSKLLALDAATGKTLWETPRPVPNSWSTPLVIEHDGRRQIVAAGDPWVIAYDPADGRELWRVKCLTGDHGITPVFVGGLLQVGNEYSQWSALRVDGQGDATETHVAWSGEDGLPDTVSPVVVNDLLLLMTSFGVMTCYDATAGEMLWEEEFEVDVSSSPGVAAGRVYLFSKDEEGKSWVLEVSREGCNRVAENRLGEPCVTSPAFGDGRIYVRGKGHLFCLGEKDGK
ncbi:MAG: PQQ-binding-like beta-propeller repeat protein [Pirellulales bacterium]|nr:PQQ-binding-like beta-propeller repeat protein [Pirellulales bacterium]